MNKHILIILALLLGLASAASVFSVCSQNTSQAANIQDQPTDFLRQGLGTAPTSVWQRTNPGGGGWFSTIGAGPTGIILAGSDLSGFYRSTDHGQSWDVIGSAQGLATTHASGIGFHPTNPSILFLGTDEGLFRSDNGGDSGESWEAGAGLPQAPLMGISLDRSSPAYNRTLFIAAQGDVYRSSDDGEHWDKVFDCNGCRFTAVDYADGDLVYAGGEGGLWRSGNGGAVGSWTAVGLPEMAGTVGGEVWEWGWEGVFAITPDPHASGTVYVAVYGKGKGLYRSTDNASHWQKLWDDDFMRDVAVSPQDPDILIATSSSGYTSGGYDAGSHGVLLSTDGGQSWRQVNEGMTWAMANPLVFDPANANRVWVGSPGTGFQHRTFAFSSPVYLPLITIATIDDQYKNRHNSLSAK